MRFRLLIIAIVLLTALLAVLISCERHIESSSPVRSLPDAGPVPRNLNVQVNDQSVILSWEVSDPSRVAQYRIYVADSTGTNFDLTDSTSGTQITISGLTKNRLHLFQVATVLTSGLEGERSATVSARLTTLSMTINGGNEFTNNRTVQVQFNTPVPVTSVIISEDSQFTDAVFETFTAVKNFTLSSGEGAKTVYADLIFTDGSTTGDPLSDKITLDTRAVIDSVFVFSQGTTYGEGDTIVFALDAGEPDGSARVSFAGQNVTLRDDGTLSDIIADDGIYTGRFIVPANFNTTNQVITGSFVDAAGNNAPNREATETLTVDPPPRAVTLFADKTNDSTIELNWTRALDNDFFLYRLYADFAGGQNVDETDSLIFLTQTQATTSFTFTGAAADSLYDWSYRVFVVDRGGQTAGSNTVQPSR